LDDSLFGTADFFRTNLKALGHVAIEAHANNLPLQLAWARERIPRPLRGLARPILRRRPPLGRILNAQIAAAKPDVILNLDMRSIGVDGLRRSAPQALLLAHNGATIFDDVEQFRLYDLVVSQVRPTVDFFEEHGIRAQELRLAFEPRVLEALDESSGEADSTEIVFVGSLFPGVHDGRIRLLEAICERFPQTGVWSASVAQLPTESAIRRCYRGQAWGKQMYEIFRSAGIVVNHHGDVFQFADNCRLYEATGVGAFLLTEAHSNLAELFEPGVEVGTYRDDDDCLETIARYLDDETGRRTIAAAGQARTLRDHTYRQRAAELVEIVEKLDTPLGATHEEPV
jgi:hypothetical protein